MTCPACAVLEASLTVERERVDRLTQELLTMRREGFNPPVGTMEKPPESPVPGKIQAALEARAKPGTQRYGVIMADVRRRLLAEEPEQAIADRILQGEDDFDG